MTYKVKNKLECRVKLGNIYFAPGETKELDFKPTSDKFIVEQIEKKEKKHNIEGGKK